MNTEMLGFGEVSAVTHPSLNRGSRGEMLAFLQTNEVPKNIKDLLANTKLKLSDSRIFSIKDVDGTTIKMFESQDIKEIGLRSISNAKMQKNQSLLISGIYLLAGYAEIELGAADRSVSPDELTSYAKTAKYYAIDESGDELPISDDADITPATLENLNVDPFAGLITGQFTLRANRVDLINESALIVFKKEGSTHLPVGYQKLSNPRYIQDDVDIEFNIELGEQLELGHFQKTVAAGGLWYAQTVFLYLALDGTMTIPA